MSRTTSVPRTVLLALGAFLVVAAGCSSAPSLQSMVQRAGNTQSVRIEDMRSVLRNGLLTAQVTIRKDDESQRVAYRYRWLSPSGVSVWDEEAWKPITLGAGQTAALVGVAPSPDAVDFRFELTQYK